jgi:hypothetical protein
VTAAIGPEAILDLAGFAPAEWCAELIEAFRATATSSQSPVRRLPRRTEIDGAVLLNTGPARLAHELGGVRERVREALRDFCAVADDELYLEYTLFAQMEIGDVHPAHADAEAPAGDGQWIPNHTSWRHSVGLLYLNTGGHHFTGGDLVFPTLGRRVTPQAGQLVGFPSGRQHWHEVTPITRGSRCSLAIWTTRNTWYREPWEPIRLP